MDFYVILEKLLAWWYANMILAIVLIVTALLLMVVSIGRSVYGHFQYKFKLDKMKEHAKQLGAMPLANGEAFVSIKTYRIYFKELVEAGLMKNEVASGKGVESALVRLVGIKPENLGAPEKGTLTCQYDEYCNERAVYEWKIRGFLYLPQSLLHEE